MINKERLSMCALALMLWDNRRQKTVMVKNSLGLFRQWRFWAWNGRVVSWTPAIMCVLKQLNSVEFHAIHPETKNVVDISVQGFYISVTWRSFAFCGLKIIIRAQRGERISDDHYCGDLKLRSLGRGMFYCRIEWRDSVVSGLHKCLCLYFRDRTEITYQPALY